LDLSNYNIDKKSKTPLYFQVEEVISSMLSKEPYSLGEKLPNELEISKKLNISRNTVRKAMYGLINKNLIIRKKNRGTFKNIDNKQIKAELNNWHSFNEDMKQKNREYKNFMYKTSTCRAPLETMQKLDLDPNQKVIKLARVKGYLEPELYVESYFHPDLNLTESDLKSKTIMKLYYFLEKKLDIEIVLSQEEILAEMPSDTIKKYLHIKDNRTPVIIRKMLVYDKNHRKIAHSIGYYLSNRFVFNLNISR